VALEGNLEDLPLLDILQVVAYSQKTGYLSLNTPRGDAAVVFRDGHIVAARSWDSPAPGPDLAGLPPDTRRERIARTIEAALARLTRLREGPFRFELTDEPPATLGGHDITSETLTEGINPEELLLELTRTMDEDRRDSVAALESGLAEPEPEPAAAPEAPAAVAAAAPAAEEDEDDLPTLELEPLTEDAPAESLPEKGRHHIVLLVEDEPDIRTSLAQHLMTGGCQVVEAGDPVSAVRTARGLANAGLPFVVVVDRGMPASDNSSFDGGLEVLKRLQQADLGTPSLLMTDRMTTGLHARARRLGAEHVVFKPSLSRLDPGQFHSDLSAFAELILRDVLPRLEELAEVPRAASTFVPLPRSLGSWDELASLQRRLEELETPRDALQVGALVMRAARDFFERGVLFLVKDDVLRGLGGFAETGGEELGLRARELSISLADPTTFADAVSEGKPIHGPLPEREWKAIAAALGPEASTEVSLLPLVSNRETIALLFGDNPNAGKPKRALDTLEVFLNQAGLVLESIFLKRRRSGRPSGGLFDDDAGPAA
jgi:CheY-like chemotaxis protein